MQDASLSRLQMLEPLEGPVPQVLQSLDRSDRYYLILNRSEVIVDQPDHGAWRLGLLWVDQRVFR